MSESELAPVDQETIAKLVGLHDKKSELALELLRIKEREILILAAASSVSLEIDRMHQRILTDRGLAPSTTVDVDPKTGALTLG